MASTRQKRLSSEPGTKERILSAATQLFAKQSYDGTSTKEICEAAKVNIAAIHYHFVSKEKLYEQIIESFGDSSLRSIQRILETPKNLDEVRLRLEMYLDEVIESMMSQPELCQIIQAEMERMHPRSESVFRRTFIKRFETLVSFLLAAKKRGIVSKELDPRIAARSLFSQICHQTRTDKVYKKYYGDSLNEPKYRRLWIRQTLNIYLEGVHAK